MHNMGPLIFDDPRTDKPLTRRQQWLMRRWDFRIRMLLRRRMRRASTSSEPIYYMGVKP